MNCSFISFFSLSASVVLLDYFNRYNSALFANCMKFEENLKYSSSENSSTTINLKEIFLKHAKTYYPKDRCSVVIYGIPEEISSDVKLYQYVMDLIKVGLKVPSLSSSHIETIRRIGSLRSWVRPVQVAFFTKETKDLVLKHKHLIGKLQKNLKIEDFISKKDIVKISILSKYAKELRKSGYNAAVRHRKLVVDREIVNTTKENLLEMFPDISARHLDGF